MTETEYDRIEAGFARLDSAIRALDDRMRQSEIKEAAFAAPLMTRVDAAWRKIDEHAAALSDIERDVARLVGTVNQLQSILRWALGIFSAVLTAILVSWATGHLSVMVR